MVTTTKRRNKGDYFKTTRAKVLGVSPTLLARGPCWPDKFSRSWKHRRKSHEVFAARVRCKRCGDDVMIYGPKDDGTYVIEFRTAEGCLESLRAQRKDSDSEKG